MTAYGLMPVAIAQWLAEWSAACGLRQLVTCLRLQSGLFFKCEKTLHCQCQRISVNMSFVHLPQKHVLRTLSSKFAFRAALLLLQSLP